MRGPCINCLKGDRFLGCHGFCRLYIAFQAANEKTKQARYAQLNKNGITIDSGIRHAKRDQNPSRIYKTSMVR